VGGWVVFRPTKRVPWVRGRRWMGGWFSGWFGGRLSGSGGWPYAKASVGRHNLRSVLLVDWLIREQICLLFSPWLLGALSLNWAGFKAISRSWLPFIFFHFHFNFHTFCVVFLVNFGCWPISLGCCSMPSCQLFMLHGQLSAFLYVSLARLSLCTFSAFSARQPHVRPPSTPLFYLAIYTISAQGYF